MYILCTMDGVIHTTNGKDVGYCRSIGSSMGISVLSQYITQLDLRLVAVWNLLKNVAIGHTDVNATHEEQ